MVYKYQVEEELQALKEVNIIEKYKDYIEKKTSDHHKIVWFPKTRMYYCTHCKKWVVIPHKAIKKGDNITCGNCRKRYEVIYVNNNIKPVEMYLTLLEKNKRNELIIRVYFYQKSYNKEYGDWTEGAIEVCRMNLDHQVAMKDNSYRPMCSYGQVYHSILNKGFTRDKTKYYTAYGYSNVLNRNIKTVIKNTEYRYSVLDKAIKQGFDAFDYLILYKKQPKIELLMKMGCFNLVKSFISEYSRNGWYFKNIDIDKRCINMIRKYDLNYDELMMYQDIKIEDYEVLKKAVSIDYKPCDTTKNIIKEIEYLYEKHYFINDYRDYIRWCEELGMNMDNKVRYPKDPVKAHDEAYIHYVNLRDEEYDKPIQEYSIELEGLSYENEDLIIRPAHSHKELIIESKFLHHCVRTYAEKMAKHETSIFFIRKKEDEESPYCTLELKKGKVNQCRGKNNARPVNAVIEFVNTWCKKNKLVSCFK